MVDGLHRVVITGLGAVTPIGNTVQDYWNGLTSGSNGVDAITLFDASSHACRFAAEVKDFDPSGFIEPKEAKRWDRFCKFGVVAAKQAVAHAGLEINDANADRIGTIIGSGVGGASCANATFDDASNNPTSALRIFMVCPGSKV